MKEKLSKERKRKSIVTHTSSPVFRFPCNIGLLRTGPMDPAERGVKVCRRRDTSLLHFPETRESTET